MWQTSTSPLIHYLESGLDTHCFIDQEDVYILANAIHVPEYNACVSLHHFDVEKQKLPLI